MPFADTGLAAPNDFTTTAGLFDSASGTATTTLTGRYVAIVDACGAIGNSGAGGIDLGGSDGQHDCTTGGGSAGNTASSRTAFYEVNKLIEQARGWLPSNSWLQSRLTANVTLTSTCNSFYNPVNGTINFQRSTGACRNAGEIVGLLDHEWGHGLDDNDANGTLSGEDYPDIAALYRLQASCVAPGFWTSNQGCGPAPDGTGFSANEGQGGALHCDLDCSGLRDADYLKHNPNTPDTALGFVCTSCNPGNGAGGKQEHCAATPVRQAAWDLVARDLRGSPFNLDSQTAFLVGNKLFYQGSGNVGTWYALTCGGSSSGCGATDGYMQWLTADDDNGNLSDGTPHMTAIFNAFDRHGIACATPTAVDSGCAAGPSVGPTLTGTAGDYQAALSWGAVPGATRYWVFRSEGHAGCDFGKTLIAETTGSSYTDAQVAAWRSYAYSVVAAGTSSACYGGASNCVTVTPTPGPPGKATTAVFNPVLGAPKCAKVGDSCDSGATLLNGRDGMSGGAEPNQPNAINHSCADGTGGSYHSDESNDRIKVSTIDGTDFAPGKTVRIEATVWVWYGAPTDDHLDLYFTATANSPSWTFLTTITPTATQTGAQTFSASYTLPAGVLQAVRARFRYQGSAASCSVGPFDDHDDLIFAVGRGTPLTATYDSTLQAPKCGTVGAACDSGATLLAGRDGISGGAEPHQPNTVAGSCADGTFGTYHSDESIDRLTVWSSDGTSFAAGKTVDVEATVWIYDSGDSLDFYYAADASSPSWQYVTSIQMSGNGPRVYSATYMLPPGSQQAIRAQLRYGGYPSPCTPGGYNDRDDLVFAVWP